MITVPDVHNIILQCREVLFTLFSPRVIALRCFCSLILRSGLFLLYYFSFNTVAWDGLCSPLWEFLLGRGVCKVLKVVLMLYRPQIFCIFSDNLFTQGRRPKLFSDCCYPLSLFCLSLSELLSPLMTRCFQQRKILVTELALVMWIQMTFLRSIPYICQPSLVIMATLLISLDPISKCVVCVQKASISTRLSIYTFSQG